MILTCIDTNYLVFLKIKQCNCSVQRSVQNLLQVITIVKSKLLVVKSFYKKNLRDESYKTGIKADSHNGDIANIISCRGIKKQFCLFSMLPSYRAFILTKLLWITRRAVGRQEYRLSSFPDCGYYCHRKAVLLPSVLRTKPQPQ